MPLLSGIYDSDPISPIAKIKENLSIWTRSNWSHFKINYIEPIPRSNPTMVEMVAASGATAIAIYGTIAKRLVAILQLNALEFLQLRWEPLDDVEGVLWQLSSTGRFASRAIHARVSRFTAIRDPYLATTTFFILGRDRAMNLEVRNPNPVALPQARFVFFGYRYLLEEIPVPTVTTYLPAEARS
ncbi:hypothetical protein ES703_14214 [subsurface metagenome]